MANEVLARQTAARARRSGETFEEALGAILRTEAGRQLQEFAMWYTAPRADEWQENLVRSRAEERVALSTAKSFRED